jgi:nucleotide-binding universal stress UspA family protein
MYRDFLVHVDASEAGRRRVQFAVDLAARVGARLSGLHVTPPAEVPPRYKPSLVPKVAAHVSSRMASDALSAATIFSDETPRCTAGTSWSEATGDVVEGISEKARYADVVILGQYERQGVAESHPLPIAHSVVLRCGRPVLVVPAVPKLGSLADIAIAWDGSREAVRAVHDALPLLRQAASVQIIKMIIPSAADDEVDREGLSTHLANHGIDVGPNILQIRTAEEHKSLQKHIEDGRYDLLLMGGYSHAMWRQFIFGGATQSILLSSKIPVLVSH